MSLEDKLRNNELFSEEDNDAQKEAKVKQYAQQLAGIILHFHKHEILVRDIGLRTVLLSEDSPLKLLLTQEARMLEEGKNALTKITGPYGGKDIKEDEYNFEYDWKKFGIIVNTMLWNKPQIEEFIVADNLQEEGKKFIRQLLDRELENVPHDKDIRSNKWLQYTEK